MGARQRQVVFTTFGSLGDLHPYLALGQQLRARGYAVRVATLNLFRERVEAAGLAFAPLRGAAVEKASPELIRGALHPRTGIEFILRTLVMPVIRQAYDDTLAAADGADLLIGHPLTFTTRLVAEKLNLPWLSTQLAPMGMSSIFDPPALPGLGWLTALGAGPRTYRTLFRFADWRTRRWLRPFDALRRELRLPDHGNPLFRGGHSPFGVLALFSPLLASPQPDWPAHTTVTGFPFYDQDVRPDPAMEAWLAVGPPPVVFTLGSSALMTPGTFFEQSRQAAHQLGARALLLGHSQQGVVNLGEHNTETPRGGLLDGDPQVYAAPYASYARIFPRAAAIVHQGGIGTTAEALRAGRPMLFVPFGVDQPDNGARVRRLGIAAVLSRRQYRAPVVAARLQHLLSKQAIVDRAAEIGRLVRAENGARTAANVIDQLLA